jgi:hypothetical protein
LSHFLNKIFRFLSSLKLAVPLLLTLAVLLATGTIVESRFSTWAAKHYVYSTWWFALFLLLLGTNVLCSALSRYPWKKHQTGFVITHSGILLILLGSLVTQQLGNDGQIALSEGEAGHTFQEDKPTFYAQDGDNAPQTFSAQFPFGAPDPDHPKTWKLDNGGLVLVNQYYFNAQKKVLAQAAENGVKGVPAVHVVLASSFVNQDQWLFLGDKDYGQTDLGPASVYFMTAADWRVKLKKTGNLIPPNALIILAGPQGSLQYQTRHRGEWKQVQPLTVGADNATGWMDMQFKVLEKRDQAIPEEQYDPQPLPEQRDPEPALHYEVLRGAERHENWIGYQSQQSFTLGGKTFGVAFGPRQLPLSFGVQLVKFNLGLDPGTDKPASYASDVNVLDPEKGTQVPTRIFMNHPLHRDGYTLFQASYSKDPDGKFISVFAVGKDPGIALKYGGALVMIFGIILMFWFKNPVWKKGEANA